MIKLGIRCVDCCMRPQAECDSTHRVPKESFTHRVAYTSIVLLNKGNEVFTFRPVSS